MTFSKLTPGLNAVSEYQASGLPWVINKPVLTASPTRFDFPRITRAFTVSAPTQDLRLGYSSDGIIATKYIIIPAGSAEKFEIKTNRIYVMGDTADGIASIHAELTNIPSNVIGYLEDTEWKTFSFI